MINTLKRWLIEPGSHDIKAEDRRRAKLLSLLLLLTILAVLAERVVGGNVPVWFLFVLLACYAGSRTAYFYLAAVGSIVMLSVPSFLMALTLEEPSSIRIISAMIWIVVPILLSSVFLTEAENGRYHWLLYSGHTVIAHSKPGYYLVDDMGELWLCRHNRHDCADYYAPTKGQ